jgi:hypothetical protein
MYLTRMKTMAVMAMRTTFDSDYPEPDFRSIGVEVEYPVLAVSIPGIWVDFDPIGPLRPVGIGHFENVAVDGGIRRAVRWSFAGNITYTAVALTSLERDRLFDQMVSTIAFGQVDAQRGEWRSTMENDPLLQVSVNYDEIDQRGFSAAPGTPWGTEQMMYEASIGVMVQGEFVSSPGTELLVPISSVNLYQWALPIETDPVPGGDWIGG